MTLRTRLTLALVALTAIGLMTAAAVTYRYVGNFLVERVDKELASAADNPRIFFPNFEPGSTSNNGVPPGTYAEFRDPSGDILAQTPLVNGQQQPHLPKGTIRSVQGRIRVCS